MSKYNLLLKKADFFEKLALYGTRKDFLRVIGQAETTVAPTVIEGPYPIDPNIQNMLSDLLVPQGKIPPLKPDGLQGPNTNRALTEFAKFFGKPATIANIKAEHAKLESQPINLEDAARQKEYLALHPEEASGLKINH